MNSKNRDFKSLSLSAQSHLNALSASISLNAFLYLELENFSLIKNAKKSVNFFFQNWDILLDDTDGPLDSVLSCRLHFSKKRPLINFKGNIVIGLRAVDDYGPFVHLRPLSDQ